MAFSIPDASEAASPELARFYQTDIDILVAGADQTGVISGTAVSASATPGASVVVAAGVVSIAGARTTVAGGTSPALPADGASQRWYLIEIDTSGNIQTVQGTAAPIPLKPAPTANRVVVASVFVPASDTAIAANQILDTRVILRAEENIRTTFSNANYTLLSTDRLVAQTGTLSAPRTVTVPAANSVSVGRQVLVIDESGSIAGTNTVTFARSGSDTINGATSLVVAQPYFSVRLVSDGTSKWTADQVPTPISGGGTGATTAVAAFDNLAPTTTVGDLVAHDGTDNVRLPVGAANRVLRSTGAAVPSWGQVNLTTDVTGTLPASSGGTGVTLATGSGSVVLSGSPTINTPVVTVNDADFTIQDDATPSKKAKFQASGISEATTRNITIPDADFTMVGADTTQTLTNKTIGVGQLSGQVSIVNGGTAASAASAAFNNLSPLTTRGDIVTRDATTNTRLPLGVNNRVLRSNGTDPVWGQIVNADITDATIVASAKISAAGASSTTFLRGDDVWAVPPGGSGSAAVASDAIWDAKGDLAVGTGADTAARLAAGVNRRLLMTDSTQTTGLKWVSDTITYVAASNTPSAQKELADYICDNTADDVEIQAAIDAVTTIGGVVQLLEGTFTITTAIAPKSNVIVRGMGPGTIVRPADATNIHVFSTATAISSFGLEHLKIDGNRANQTTGGVGYRFSGAALDCWIRFCEITATWSNAISFNSQRCRVEQNNIHDCNGGVLLNSGASGIMVAYNDIRAIGVEWTTIADAISNQGNHNAFIGNRCQSTDTGINLAGSHHLCIGNVCYLNGNSGINSGGGDHLLIANNFCYANGRKIAAPRSNAGIRIRDHITNVVTSNDVTVTGNRCYEDDTTYTLQGGALGQLYGIEVVQGDAHGIPDNLIITDNNLRVVDAAPSGWTPILWTSRGNDLWVSDNVGDSLRVTFSDANYTAFQTDRVISQIGTLSGARTVTLPAANSLPQGRQIVIIDESGSITTTNTLGAVRAGSDTINGAASVALSRPYSVLVLTTDGTSKWTRTAVAGVDVQAFDQDLADIAGLTRTRGDLVIGGASAWIRLAIGGANTVLRSDGTDPSWGQIVNANIANTTIVASAKINAAGASSTTFLRGDDVWATPPGGAAAVATDTIWDAKGDLVVGNGADAAVRLPVGAARTALVVDPAASASLRWAQDAQMVVAAVDSPSVMTAMADYVCDGVGDEVEIQTAINALLINGGTIRLLPGNYTFAVNGRVTLSGSKPLGMFFDHGAIFKATAGHAAASPLIAIEASNCDLYNPTVQGTGVKGNGIGIQLGNDNNTVHACAVYSATLSNLDSGIEFGVNLVNGNSSGDNIAIGGRITNCKAGIRSRGFVNWVHGMFISGCDYGIHGTTDRNSHRINVRDVTINQWSTAGILIERGRGSTFDGIWMEHTADQSVANPTAIVIGSAGNEVRNVEFGTAHIHLLGGPSASAIANHDQYALKLVNARGLRFNHLEMTDDLDNTQFFISKESTFVGDNNIIDKISIGDTSPTNYAFSRITTGSGTGELIIRAVPDFSGATAGATIGETTIASPVADYTVAKTPSGIYFAKTAKDHVIAVGKDSGGNIGNFPANAAANQTISFPGTPVSGLKTVLDAVKAAGVHIHFAPGTYDYGFNFNSTFVNLTGLTISGSGRENTFLQNYVVGTQDLEPLSCGTAERYTIRDLTVCAGGDLGVSGVGSGSTADAIDLDQGKNCLVENSRVLASRDRAIVIDGKDSGSTNISLAHGNIIRSNIIDGTQTAYSGSTPSAAAISTGSLAVQAYVYKVSQVDAHYRESTVSSPSASVTPGASQFLRVTVPVGPAGTVARKIYRSSAAQTTFFLVATLFDNTTTTFDDDLSDGTLSTDPGTIKSGNSRVPVATIGGRGIELLGTHRSLVNDNIVIATTNDGIGMIRGGATVVNSDNNVIRDNFVRNAQEHGISVIGGSGNMIEGNRCLNNGQGGAFSGISISGVSNGTTNYNTVARNVCWDDQASKTQDSGVAVSSAASIATGTRLLYNIVVGNQVNSLNNAGAGTIIRGNYVGAGTGADAIADTGTSTAYDYLSTDQLWAAKGDLAVATGNNAGSVLPVGANDTVLIADSALGLGVKWATIGTNSLGPNVVTFAKFVQVTQDVLIGRDATGLGDVTTISLGGGIEFTGANAIQRSALTGHIQAPAGSNTTTIQPNVVTPTMLQNNGGTASATTFYRGDGQWQSPAGGPGGGTSLGVTYAVAMNRVLV